MTRYRALLILPITAILLAGMVAHERRHTPASPATHVATAVDPSSPLTQERPAPKTKPGAPLDAAAPDAHVASRYALLLDALSPSMQTQVLHALTLRETEDSSIDAAIEIERQLSRLLDAQQYALYERLRDSQSDQAFVQAFARSLDAELALSESQQRGLLLARLEHLYEVQALELQASVPRDDLATMEREYVRDVALQGIAHHRQQFLQAARAVLTSEQWRALEEFVTKGPPEFSR